MWIVLGQTKHLVSYRCPAKSLEQSFHVLRLVFRNQTHHISCTIRGRRGSVQSQVDTPHILEVFLMRDALIPYNSGHMSTINERNRGLRHVAGDVHMNSWRHENIRRDGLARRLTQIGAKMPHKCIEPRQDTAIDAKLMLVICFAILKPLRRTEIQESFVQHM